MQTAGSRAPARADGEKTNKLTAGLLPSDVVARVAPVADRIAGFEIELARQPAESGPRFPGFGTCCRGPVEFDLAHVTAEVGEGYAGGDRDLLSECRGLVLAMLAAWRCAPARGSPPGRQEGLATWYQ